MTSGRTYKDLCINIPGIGLTRNAEPAKMNVSMFWSNEAPSEISMGFKAGDHGRVFWFISRSLLIASNQEWSRDAWLGGKAWGGNVSACWTKDRLMITLTGTDAPTMTVVIPGESVKDFLDHSVRIVQPGAAEVAVNMAHLERELDKILG